MNKYKLIFVRYSHIIAITICISFNAMWFLAIGDPEAEKIQEELEELFDLLNHNRVSIKNYLEKDYYEIVKRNWSISLVLEPAPNSTAIYPGAEFYFPPPLSLTYWIKKPSKISVDVQEKSIFVFWEPADDLLPNKKDTDKIARVEGYELVKTWQDAEGCIQSETFVLDKYQRQFEDQKVETKTQYVYRIRSYTKNLQTKGQAVEIKGTKVIASDYTDPVKGEIPSTFEMKLLGVAGDTAFLKLRRWYKNKWYEHPCYIKKGKPIEVLHAKVPGLEESIDFIPEWTLVDIKYRVPKTIMRNGKKAQIYTFAIVYQDEKGLQKTLRWE